MKAFQALPPKRENLRRSQVISSMNCCGFAAKSECFDNRPMSLADSGRRIENCFHRLRHNLNPPIRCPQKTNFFCKRHVVDAMTTLLQRHQELCGKS